MYFVDMRAPNVEVMLKTSGYNSEYCNITSVSHSSCANFRAKLKAFEGFLLSEITIHHYID